MSPLTLHLHGVARVVLSDGRELRLERRAAALCALAALAPGLPRERAALWLWPDSGDARRNLRQQLLRFRQQCGQAVLAGDERLALAAGVVLAAAEDGLLLQDHDFGDSAELAAWVDAQRQVAASVRTRALRDEIAAAEAAGDLEHALEVALRQATADPHSEAAARELMRLHYLRGEAAAGLAVYEQLCARLASGDGSTADATTRELAEALRRSRAPGSGLRPVAAGLPVTLRRPPVMAGREAEFAAVQRAWGDGCAVLIEGEAGLGKSRLIAEFAAEHVGTRAALAAGGRPGDAGAPYATLARLVAPLLRLPAPALDKGAQQALAHIAPGASAGPATAPLRPGALLAAVDALLGAHAVHTVVIDDLHFADAATLELVAGLASAPEPQRRWLLAMRPVEAPAAAQALRDALTELQRLEVVALAPLSEGAVGTLVDALAIAGLDGMAIAPALVRHTGGNPLYLLETLKQGLQDGSLARGLLPRPAAVGTLIERRLQRLSEPALALARVAAIAGIDFCIELAEAATGQSAVQLASPWRELQDAQVLRDEAFAHDLVADAALRGVPPVVARRVHAQCAAWLEAHGIEPARVARHWRAGGEPARAGRAFVAAAQRADKSSRLQEEAALLAEAALALADAGLADESFDARCERARALVHADFGDLALHELGTLVAQASGVRQQMRAQRELVSLLTERGESAEAVEAGQRLLALARAQGDHVVQLRTACHMASALGRLGRSDEALSLLLPLREWVDGQGDDALRMLWHGDWAAALGNLGRLQEAVASYEVARAAARRADLPDAESRLMLNAAVALRQSGRFEQALALAHQGQALSSADGLDATHRGIARLVIARDECETGRYDSALVALEELLPQFAAARAAFWTQATRMVLATLWLRLGQPARAVPLLRDDDPGVPAWLRADRQLLRLELAQQLDQTRPGDALPAVLALAVDDPQRGPWLRVRALAHQPPPDALRESRALLAELGRTEREGVRMALEVQLARAALATGLLDEAADTATRMLARFGQGIAPDGVYRAEACWIGARALHAAGRRADASRALAQGAQWISRQALPHVPAAFIDSFLHRNPVNRALLAAAAAAG
jgi:DNA-binding SARP family transcriptional activator/tetratricopeptide (TPR) repeat protein